MSQGPRIAFVPWGDTSEDWWDPLGITFESFCEEMAGGWLFGYVEALGQAGVGCVLVIVTRTVDWPTRRRHRSTGATIWAFPPSRFLDRLRVSAFDHGRIERRLDGPRRYVASATALSVRGIGRVVRSERCGAILCQDYENPRFDACIVVGRALGIPVFATYQGGSEHVSRLERILRPPALRLAARLIIPAEEEARRVTERYRLPARKIARVPNPLDVAAWQPLDRHAARTACEIEPDTTIVANHGRIEMHDKGLDVLLDAWELVSRRRRGRKLALVLMGSGNDAAALSGELARRQLVDIRFVEGFRLDRQAIRTWLSAADVFAFAARYEGFPIAPLEAMASGLPVVATAASGIPEIFDEGEKSGGIVVPVGRADILAAAIGRVIDDADLRRELGVRARRRVTALCGLEVTGPRLREVLEAGGMHA